MDIKFHVSKLFFFLFLPSVVKILRVKNKLKQSKLEWSLVVVAGKAVVQQDGVEVLNSD